MKDYFEKKIPEYACKFDLIDQLAENQIQASGYFAWVRDGYKKYFANVPLASLSKFYIRYYRAKKLLYSSVQMLVEAKCSLRNECVLGFYYLIYYALFHAMQANIILCVEFNDDIVLDLPHNSVRTYFYEKFCKNNKCPVDNEIVTFFDALRSYREYYSYAKPFNLANQTILDIDRVEHLIRLCIQLFNLHCWIIWHDVKKTFEFDISNTADIKSYFCASCNRLKTDDFIDPADSNMWTEFKEQECGEILPISIAYEHDFDEYGTYDQNVYQAMKIPHTGCLLSEALKFLYESI